MKPRLLLLSLLLVLLMAGNGFALELGMEITIWDGMGVLNEDQEVEPNCVWDQAWDLEGFFLKDTMLTMVGGYDFKDGYGNFAPGDIFIDTDFDAVYGPNNQGSGGSNGEIQDTFGYEYALVFDRNTDGSGSIVVSDNGAGTYAVYKLIPNTTTLKVYYAQNDESNPFAYVSGGELLGRYDLTFYEAVDNSTFDDWPDPGGSTHYALTVDLADIGLGSVFTGFISHYTYECGNDNLMGRIPDASALMLLGSAMIGVAIMGRKKVFSRKG